MKLITLILYTFLTLSWIYILIFSFKEIKKDSFSSRSLFTILFVILIIDSIRTIIESFYFGTRLASQYGVIPKEIFVILSNPSFLFLPKLINAIAAISIIFLIFKRWQPEKLKEDEKLKEKYEQEKKDKEQLSLLNKELDTLVKEKTLELEELNHQLENRVKEEIEKNKIQEQKLFSQTKMASMGEMLKNIAHQWRQPLSTISAISSGNKIKQELGVLQNDELIKDLDQITLTSKHLSETIQDFQDFFKPNKELQYFNFKETINSALKIITPAMKTSFIEIEVNINCNCKIVGPYNEYTQVLLNILNNSKDALVEKVEDDRIIKIDTKKEGEYCSLIVSDNAGGIDENIINRIFEPYFTTKHQYHGTGLGLYMSKEIIEKHMDGNLEVKNIEFEYKGKTYKGAQFKIKTKSLLPNTNTCEL